MILIYRRYKRLLVKVSEMRNVSKPFALGMVIFTALLFLSDTTYAQSIDCARVRTNVERIVCADTSLVKFDQLLTKIYQEAKEKAGKHANLIRKSQKKWLKDRNICKDNPCLTINYLRRIAQLQNYTQVLQSPDGGDINKYPYSLTPTNASDRQLPLYKFSELPADLRGRHLPNMKLYEREQKVMEKVRLMFLSHINSATNVTIPYIPEEFPWKINWARQQAYCQDIWKALSAEEEQRVQYFNHPTASLTRDGTNAIWHAWEKIDFLRKPYDYLYLASRKLRIGWGGIESVQTYVHDPDWAISISVALDGIESQYSPLISGFLIFAMPSYGNGNYAGSTLGYKYDVHRQDISFNQGGIENFYVMVDSKPLLIRFGRYASIYDGTENNVLNAPTSNVPPYYLAWFGKRKGHLGQGFIAVESPEINLYSSLALEGSGYTRMAESMYGDKQDGPILEGPFGFHEPVCVINFDMKK